MTAHQYLQNLMMVCRQSISSLTHPRSIENHSIRRKGCLASHPRASTQPVSLGSGCVMSFRKELGVGCQVISSAQAADGCRMSDIYICPREVSLCYYHRTTFSLFGNILLFLHHPSVNLKKNEHSYLILLDNV
jgi:hypothetical protein